MPRGRILPQEFDAFIDADLTQQAAGGGATNGTAG